jgi:CheY-like chemotaxis protein
MMKPAVAYIEDDARSRTVLNVILNKRMALEHVTILEDSSNFLSRLEALEPRPDVILLDIHMKPFSGFEMLPVLRQSERLRGVPIVALTASVMNEEVNLLQQSGFDGCLAKPINLAIFPELLEKILAGEHVWTIL